jgi:pyridoxamine 5'-phosphate oxidase
MAETVDSDDISRQIWVQLQRASVDRHHEWRTPVLASIGLDGSVQARTVVLRRADIEAQRLLFYTDRRSPKVLELKANPAASLVFWSRRLSWQIRAQVSTRILEAGPVVDSAWASVAQSPAAGDYLSSAPPGSVLPAPTLAPETPAELDASQPLDLHSGPHQLAVVCADVLSIDWLELSRAGHRRALLTAGASRWLVP